MDGLYRFHAIDFSNRNVSLRNVILRSSANEVVFIDFSFGDRAKGGSNLGKNSEKYQMHYQFVDAMICGQDIVDRAGQFIPPEHLPILWLKGTSWPPSFLCGRLSYPYLLSPS